MQKDRKNTRRLKTSYISTVLSLSLVLYTLGILAAVIFHAGIISDYVKENIGFTVMMKNNVKDADIKMLQKNLDAAPYVKSTEFVTKEKAAELLRKDLGEDFVSFLGYNPLPPSIDVRLNAGYANPDSVAVIEKIITTDKNVKEIFYQKTLVQSINENIRRISIFILGFSLLLLIIAIALINNTIRLAVYSKRFIIKSMQLLGATRSFIRKPFLIRGIVQGIIGGLIALILLYATIYFIENQFSDLIIFSNLDLLLLLFVFVMSCGVFISWISTYFAIRKYLKIKTDNLYYY